MLWAARLAALAVHGLSFALCALGAALSESPHKSERERRAVSARTWGRLVASCVVAMQHLTVCSLGLLVLYLALVCVDPESETAGALAAVLMPLQTVVGVLYWALALYDPWLLFPREQFPEEQKLADAVLRRITRVPALGNPGLLFMWALMQQQHTFAPLHLWVEAYTGVLPASALALPGSPVHECAVTAAVGLGYLAWNMLCWQVRGVPPYPVQKQVGWWFYGACLLVLLLATLCSHWTRQRSA
jgi:hypothetical protein